MRVAFVDLDHIATRLRQPAGVEQAYARALKHDLAELERNPRVRQALGRIVAAYEDHVTLRNDAITARGLRALMRRVREAIRIAIGEWTVTVPFSIHAAAGIDHIMDRTKEEARRQGALTVVPKLDTWRDRNRSREVERWTREQAKRARRLPESVLAPKYTRLQKQKARKRGVRLPRGLAELVEEAARQGRPVSEVRKIIKGRFKAGRAKADYIAVDGLGTLNGRIRNAAAVASGATHFRCLTMLDRFVRKVHAREHGRVHSYANKIPGFGSGGEAAMPGEPHRCRCVDQPMWVAKRLVV